MENAVEIRDFAFFASFRDFWGVFWGHYGCEMDIPGYFNEKCSLRKIKYMDGIFWASGIEWYWFGQNRSDGYWPSYGWIYATSLWNGNGLENQHHKDLSNGQSAQEYYLAFIMDI